MTNRRLVTIIAWALIAAAGCHRGKPLDEGVRLLQGSGFSVDGLREVPATRLAATACRGGTVGGLDVLLCSYGTTEARTRSEHAAEAWIGAAVTGTWAERDLDGNPADGHLLLLVADRSKADLNGRAISKLVSSFRPRK